MTVKFLLDTNAYSEPLRANPDGRVLRHLKQHKTELAIAAPVWHEMLVGCFRLPISKKRAHIEKYLATVTLPVLPYDAESAKWHAAERARLMSIGKIPPFVDGQIAAIAATQNLTLVTFNVADFENFQGLNVVNWRK